EHDAEFLCRHCEHKIRMAFRQNAFHRAFTWSAAEPAAARERFQRNTDVEIVARCGVEKPFDAPRDVRNREIGPCEASRRGCPKAPAPAKPHPGHEEQRTPD